MSDGPGGIAEPAAPTGPATLDNLPVEIATSGNSTSLTLPAGGNVDPNRPATQSTVTVFRQTEDGVGEASSVDVTREGDQISLTSGAPAGPASPPVFDPGSLQTVTAPLTLAGVSADITVGISPDGVVVITVSSVVAGALDEDVLILSALALLEMQLGVDHTSVTAIVLQTV